MRGELLALVGGQYGEEGKGRLAQVIAGQHYGIHVRVPRGGQPHTCVVDGQREVVHVLPTSWSHEETLLVVGPGAILDVEALRADFGLVARYGRDLGRRLFLDGRMVILPNDANVAETEIRKLQRDPTQLQRLSDFAALPEHAWLRPFVHHNAMAEVEALLQKGQNVLLEGSGGSATSLVTGHWPFVNSYDTNAAGLVALAGLSPRFLTRVVLAVRTLPVRPVGIGIELKTELDWSELERRGVEVDPALRTFWRLGEWDDELIIRALGVNTPTSIALTHLDLLAPMDTGKTELDDLSARSKSFLSYVEARLSIPVALVGTGGHELSIIDRGRKL